MTRSTRLVVVLVLNLVLVTALVVVGLTAGSLGVLAAGADYLADAAAIGVALLAVWLSHCPPTSRRPDGYPKATTLAALVNGSWLLVLCLFVAGEGIARLLAGAPHVDGLPVLIVSGTAALVMLGGALILGGDVDEDDDNGGDLSMRAVLLDTAGDAAAAAGVAVTGGIILATRGLFWLDPAAALAIAVVIAYHAFVLLKEVVAALKASDGRALGGET